MHKWSKRAFYRLLEKDLHRWRHGLRWYRIVIFNERTKSVLLGTGRSGTFIPRLLEQSTTRAIGVRTSIGGSTSILP